MTRGELRYCPECRRPWPKGAEHDLRSFRWLDDLPRYISPDNIDCILHDGSNGRNRFLVLETKRRDEPVQKGQAVMLKALAGLAPERLGVRILAGNLTDLSIHRVTRDGIEERGTSTTPEKVRGAVATWLNGSTWRDAESAVAVRRAPVAHVCEWQRKDAETFACIRCGEVWRPAA